MGLLQLFQSTLVFLGPGRNEMVDSKDIFNSDNERSEEHVYAAHTLVFFYIFRLSLSSVSLLTLSGKDPL